MDALAGLRGRLSAASARSEGKSLPERDAKGGSPDHLPAEDLVDLLAHREDLHRHVQVELRHFIPEGFQDFVEVSQTLTPAACKSPSDT